MVGHCSMFFWSSYKTDRVNHAGVLGTQRTETNKYTYYKLFSYICIILFLNPKKNETYFTSGTGNKQFESDRCVQSDDRI